MSTSAPGSCKAAVLVERGALLRVMDVEVPRAIEPGAILVETISATVCGSDVHLAHGATTSMGPRPDLPAILGHEMTGRIVRLGRGVTADSVGNDLAVGDRIVWTHGFCGQCPSCVIEHEPALCSNIRRYMFSSCSKFPFLTGAFAEYGYVFPTSGRVRVPESVDDDVAAASSCSLRTIVHAFDRLGNLDDRHNVVIQGAGPLGLFALAKALTAGPSRVIMIGGPRDRLTIAEGWGAQHTIDVAATSAAERRELVRGLTGGRGADVVIEVSGAPEAFDEGIEMLRPGGRYLVVGQIHDVSRPFNPSVLVLKQANVIGSMSGSVEHYARALDFLQHRADRFRWADMISNRYPLTEINDAFDRMSSFSELKPAIRFDR